MRKGEKYLLVVFFVHFGCILPPKGNMNNGPLMPIKRGILHRIQYCQRSEQMAEETKKAAGEETAEARNFIHALIEEDIAPGGQYKGMTVHTRFPPEPNGYLHIGHCKALCIDFGTAEKFGGICNLRMDDTNPSKEDTEYVDAIQEDIRWLGFTWDDRFYMRRTILNRCMSAPWA